MEEVIRSVSQVISDRVLLQGPAAIDQVEWDLRRRFGLDLVEHLPTDGTPVLLRVLREETPEPYIPGKTVHLTYELRQAHSMNDMVFEPRRFEPVLTAQDSINPFLQSIKREVVELANDIQSKTYDRAEELRERVQLYRQIIGRATEQLDAALTMADVAAGAAAALRDEKLFDEITRDV